MSTPDLHQLAGAFVVDALDDDERSAFETHLAGCEECTAEVAELRETAARLAVLSTQDPPASLRDKVLAGAATTRQVPPLTAVEPRAAVADEPEAVVRPSRWARRLALPVAAALLGVLAISLGAWGVSQRDRADQLTASAALVTSVLTAPDATSTSAAIGPGRASVVVSPANGRAVLVGTGLATPAPGKVYEMWRVDAAGRIAPAGTYVPGRDGNVAVSVDGPLDGIKTVAVTFEPEGGSAQPTSTPLAGFTLA